MGDELKCGICLEDIVDPMLHTACGVSYCTSCLETQKNCPSCRKKYTKTSLVPNRGLSGVVRARDPDRYDRESKRRKLMNTPEGVADELGYTIHSNSFKSPACVMDIIRMIHKRGDYHSAIRDKYHVTVCYTTRYATHSMYHMCIAPKNGKGGYYLILNHSATLKAE